MTLKETLFLYAKEVVKEAKVRAKEYCYAEPVALADTAAEFAYKVDTLLKEGLEDVRLSPEDYKAFHSRFCARLKLFVDPPK